MIIMPGQEIDFVLSKLKPREEEIIRLHFGLKAPDFVRYTLEEIGKIFGCTRERIRQIEADAFEKMRHFVLCRILVDHMCDDGDQWENEVVPALLLNESKIRGVERVCPVCKCGWPTVKFNHKLSDNHLQCIDCRREQQRISHRSMGLGAIRSCKIGNYTYVGWQYRETQFRKKKVYKHKYDEKSKIRAKAYYYRHREEILVKNRLDYQINREKILKQKRLRYWRKKNLNTV